MFVVAVAAGLLASVTNSSAAHADVFTIAAQLDGGGMFGKGIGGDQKATAFHATAPRGTYGLKLNAEVLFIDMWLAHHQFTDASRLATWSELGIGMDTELPLGDSKHGGGGYLALGVGATFGVGTGQQVQPRIDANMVTSLPPTYSSTARYTNERNNSISVCSSAMRKCTT